MMPDTNHYMLLGLVAIGVLVSTYILTLVFRFHTVKRDRQFIEQLRVQETCTKPLQETEHGK